MTQYTGNHVEVESLVGRNYYHYVNGIADKEQPFEVFTNDIAVYEAEDIEDDFKDASIDELAFTDCWVKRIAPQEEDEAICLVAIELDNDFNITGVMELSEVIQYTGCSLFADADMLLPLERTYEVQDALSDKAENELELLLKHRIIPRGLSFIGKKLPLAITEDAECKDDYDDNCYSYVMPSAYRSTYMCMCIETEDGKITDMENNTYRSYGGCQSMFMRPEQADDRQEELVDMLLYIVDRYTDEEYSDFILQED